MTTWVDVGSSGPAASGALGVSGGGLTEVQQVYTPAEDMTVAAVGVYFAEAPTPGTYTVGVASNPATYPPVLVCSGTVVNPVVGENVVTMTAPATLAGGTAYAVGVHGAVWAVGLAFVAAVGVHGTSGHLRYGVAAFNGDTADASMPFVLYDVVSETSIVPGRESVADTQATGFFGWSPESDAERASYSIGGGAGASAPDRLSDSTSTKPQRTRGT